MPCLHSFRDQLCHILDLYEPPSALEASLNMVMQNGQPTARVFAPVSLASLKRASFTRIVPFSSSFHICAPPAPQQKDLAELRGISIVRHASGIQCFTRRIENLVMPSQIAWIMEGDLHIVTVDSSPMIFPAPTNSLMNCV